MNDQLSDDVTPDAASLRSAATVAGGTGEPMITLRGVDKFFGEFQALSSIDLVVGKQEVVVVIGPSGSGIPASGGVRPSARAADLSGE